MSQHDEITGRQSTQEGTDGTHDALMELSAEERQAHLDRLFAGDYLLSDLVDVANRGVGVPITITVGGLVITGNLASSEQYFDHALTIMDNIQDEALAQAMRSRIESNRPNPYSSERVPGMPPSFIHVMNARYIDGAARYLPPLSSKPIMWRGKISSVDGFSLGIFEPANDD